MPGNENDEYMRIFRTAFSAFSRFFRLEYGIVFMFLVPGMQFLSVNVHAVSPGSFNSYSTLHSIGMEWDITDDADHDAVCTVVYKTNGSTVWRDALPLYRVDFAGADMVAGSIFFLDPATTYDVKLALTDPDGGDYEKIFSIQTKVIPQKPLTGNTYFVMPGTGGGTGTKADPFQGIDTAQAVAAPGDTFILLSGSYSGETEFTVSGSSSAYIVWKGAGDGTAIFETLRVNGDHIWIEGLHIEGNDYGLRTYNAPEDVVITKNTFEGCNYCIYLNHGGSGWYIADNIIKGNVEPSSGSFTGEGVELNHSNDHTVAYNSISRVADGVSYPNQNCDILGNDIFDVSDDGIEGDYGYANIRIWGNRISNALHNGISLQPMNGAPWYILRNQVAAPLESGLKFRDAVDRALIAHNTFVGWNGVLKSGSEYLINVQSNNNLYITVTPFYAWENTTGGSDNWKTDLDYDGFDWGEHVYGFKWGGSNRYEDLAEFTANTGLEPNGIQVNKNAIFNSFSIPDPPPAAMPKQYLTLKPGCNAQDAGVILPNINDGYTGPAPDLGAYEIGVPLPQYGPREENKIIVPPLIPLLLEESD